MNSFVIAMAPSIQSAFPSLMISYVYDIDDHNIGVVWQNTTGGSLAIPAATYELAVLV
jgi:hypothetical protein